MTEANNSQTDIQSTVFAGRPQEAVARSQTDTAMRNSKKANDSQAKRPLRRFDGDSLTRELLLWKAQDPKRRLVMIGKELGVDMKTLANWRWGVTVPDANEVLKLEWLLDLPADRLTVVVATRR